MSGLSSDISDQLHGLHVVEVWVEVVEELVIDKGLEVVIVKTQIQPKLN